jgi:DNA (cytosine-5)-methyltransferase 1
MIKILDVCSGIGGFSLGLEATGGFDTVAFCEYDEFCRKVLNKHWPEVPIYKDLKEIGNEPTRLIQEFDLICGGIPCQPFSLAGKQKGKEDDRHLWPYMYEIIKHKKPTWVIVENVGGFVNVALDDVCLNLETEGYATQSFIIPACGVSAPHKRDRIWILGKLMDDSKRNEHIEEIRGGDGEEREDEKRQGEEDSTSRISSGASGLRVSDQGHETSGHVADSNSGHDNGEKEEVRTRGQASDDGSTGGGTEDVADTEFKGLQGGENSGTGSRSRAEVQATHCRTQFKARCF